MLEMRLRAENATLTKLTFLMDHQTKFNESNIFQKEKNLRRRIERIVLRWQPPMETGHGVRESVRD